MTKEVVLDAEGPTPEGKDPFGNTRIGASASTKIKRSDFGLTWNAALETKASAELLPMFGIQPLLGRVLSSSEMEPGKDYAVVIGYRLWQTRYGADPAILGKTIDLDQKRYAIVGVFQADMPLLNQHQQER